MFCLGTLLIPIFSTPVFAHRVTVFAWVENGQIYTQSKFGAGAKVNNGKISVYDDAGKELLSGQTDENGEFSFPIPAHSALNIVLDATMGHRAEWTIPLGELGVQEQQDLPHPVITNATQPAVQTQGSELNAAQLEAIIDKVLDRKLKPISHLLAAMNQTGPSWHDIIAGLGYIAGIIGITAWVRAQKQRH
jgi:nickel transport protein